MPDPQPTPPTPLPPIIPPSPPPGDPPPAPTPTQVPVPPPAPPPQPPSGAIEAKDIVIPEGFEKNDALLGEFTTILNDGALDRKGLANKLIELQAKALKTASEKGSEVFVQQQQEWQNQVRSDPEIGGAGLDAKLGNISKLLDLFGGSKPAQGAARDATKLRQVLDTTGAGNHPEMVRFLSNIAEAMVTEGKIVPAGAPSSGPKDVASLLFDGKK